jgi:hypothetical protein
VAVLVVSDVVAVVAAVVELVSSLPPQPAASRPSARTPATARIRWFFRILASIGF